MDVFARSGFVKLNVWDVVGRAVTICGRDGDLENFARCGWC